MSIAVEREQQIIKAASQVVAKYHALLNRESPGITRLEMFPLDHEAIVRRVCHLNYVETQIDRPESFSALQRETFIAGMLDRPGELVVVDPTLESTCKRFTVMHEVGHFYLHHQDELFRDIARSNGVLFGQNQPPFEIEADIFAAHSLMPEEDLRPVFEGRYGSELDGRKDPRVFEILFGASGDAADLPPLKRAALVATSPIDLKGQVSKSLCKIFGVSPKAMARQLVFFGMVR